MAGRGAGGAGKLYRRVIPLTSVVESQTLDRGSMSELSPPYGKEERRIMEAAVLMSSVAFLKHNIHR